MRNVIGILFIFTVANCFGQAPTPTTSAVAPAVSVTDAQEKLEHGHPEEAIAALQQLAATHPPVKGANRELGIAYYRTGKLEDADKSFAAATAEDPSDIESIQMRGLTLYRLGRPSEAIPYLERVRQWTPNANADANYVLGLCYMNSQRIDEARTAFAAQYAVEPTSAAAYLLVAQMLLRADMSELAAQNALKAIEITPKIPLAHFLLGEVFLAKSDTENALKHFELERSVNPAYAAIYDRLGDVYTKSEKYQQAQESLSKAISLDQSSTGPFIQMGKVFLKRNDPQTALMYLLHAEKMDPGSGITHTLLGQAYRGLGREEDARREMEAASKSRAAAQLKPQPVQ